MNTASKSKGEAPDEKNGVSIETPENAACCGNCIFWILTHKRGTVAKVAGGQCRRMPPVPLVVTQQLPLQPDKHVQSVMAHFPTTAEDMYCGEYDPGDASSDEAEIVQPS